MNISICETKTKLNDTMHLNGDERENRARRERRVHRENALQHRSRWQKTRQENGWVAIGITERDGVC
jgi:hypothetical protein